MATYCIGDLHGKDKLFFKLLDKISFDPSVDTLYLLGDVIDRDGSGLSILQYAMEHRDSVTLLLGNHEEQFLRSTKLYDYLFATESSLCLYKDLVASWSQRLYKKIESPVMEHRANNRLHELYLDKRIEQWVQDGGKKQNRRNLLSSLCSYFSSLEGDPNLIDISFAALRSLDNHYKGSKFVLDVLSLTSEDYCAIKSFVASLPTQAQVIIEGRSYVLTHERPKLENTAPSNRYVHGHTPVPMESKFIHLDTEYKTTSFEFEKGFFFFWQSETGTRIYNLDLGSDKKVGALCLDDLNEHYICNDNIYLCRNIADQKHNLCQSQFYEDGLVDLTIENKPRGNYSFVSYTEGCCEFLIGVQVAKKRIIYSRITLCLTMDEDNPLLVVRHCMTPVRIIDNSYNNQPIPEIIELVRKDYQEYYSTTCSS